VISARVEAASLLTDRGTNGEKSCVRLPEIKYKNINKKRERDQKSSRLSRWNALHLYIRHCKLFTLRLMPIRTSRNISPAIGLFVCMCLCGLFVRDLAQSLLAEQATGRPLPLVRSFGYVTYRSCISAIKSPASNNYSQECVFYLGL
jgi:hypothetical protein